MSSENIKIVAPAYTKDFNPRVNYLHLVTQSCREKFLNQLFGIFSRDEKLQVQSRVPIRNESVGLRFEFSFRPVDWLGFPPDLTWSGFVSDEFLSDALDPVKYIADKIRQDINDMVEGKSDPFAGKNNLG